MSATWRVSSSLKPRWLIQGVPKRTPEGFKADLSPGIVFRLVTIPATSSMRAARSPLNQAPSLPVTDLVSIFVRWVFVPPKGILKPLCSRWSLSTRQFLTICFIKAANSSVLANLNARAIAPKTFTCGPPCSPGNTARSMARMISRSVLIKIAPRGPRRVLCVVEDMI